MAVAVATNPSMYWKIIDKMRNEYAQTSTAFYIFMHGEGQKPVEKGGCL